MNMPARTARVILAPPHLDLHRHRFETFRMLKMLPNAAIHLLPESEAVRQLGAIAC